MNYSKKYKKKLCFFLPSLKTGGAEKVFVNLANHFAKKNKHKVFLIVGNTEKIYQKQVNNRVKFINLKSTRLRYTLIKLIKIFKKENFQVVFSTMPHSNVFLCLLKKIFNFKFKLYVRQSNVYEKPLEIEPSLISRIYIYLMRKTYPYADGVISTSDAVNKETEKYFYVPKNKNFLIRNPIDSKKIFKLSQQKISLDLKKNAIKIISIGKLSAQKNFASLIDCIYFLKKNTKKTFQVLIIGEGKLYSNLKKKIDNLKLYDEIKIIKFVDNPYKYISKFDMLVQPSLWEGSSNVLLEALSCKIKVVCYKIPGGTNEILKKNRFGLLAKFNDYKDLSRKILKSHELKKSFRNSRQFKNLKLFDVKKNFKMYYDLINKS